MFLMNVPNIKNALIVKTFDRPGGLQLMGVSRFVFPNTPNVELYPIRQPEPSSNGEQIFGSLRAGVLQMPLPAYLYDYTLPEPTEPKMDTLKAYGITWSGPVVVGEHKTQAYRSIKYMRPMRALVGDAWFTVESNRGISLMLTAFHGSSVDTAELVECIDGRPTGHQVQLDIAMLRRVVSPIGTTAYLDAKVEQAKSALEDILKVTGRLKCISGMDKEWYPLDTPAFKYHKD